MKEIILTQGKVALVDDEDYAEVNQFSWCAQRHAKGWYACRGLRLPNGKMTTQALHRFLMPGVREVDHRNRDGLDNRRSNLRPSSRRQNTANRAKFTKQPYKGIRPARTGTTWSAFCCQKYLGNFSTAVEAAKAYDKEARLQFGEFASTNF